jgi:Siphovirus ReqiPepy6 Gp37-like protein
MGHPLADRMVTGWRVQVRDRDLWPTGQVDVFTSMKLVLRHRRAGTWSLALPASHPQARLFGEGCGVLVWAPWSGDIPLMSGPVTTLQAVTPTQDSPPLLTVNGADDTALLADRLTLPTPLAADDQQTVDSHWTGAGPAEHLIRDLVDAQAGDAGRPDRRICNADPDNRRAAGLTVGTWSSVSARFDNLLTQCDEIAAIDNLTLELVQPSGSVQDRWLRVGLPVDRSDSVRLTQPAGTLTQATATIAAPTATHVLVAGGGEGIDRLLTQRADPDLAATWARRIETFRDQRGTNDLTQLAQAGDEVLAQAAATAGIACTPADTPSQRYGYEYGLGDTVTVEVGETTWTDVITGVDITLDAQTATTIVPLVGDPDLADLKTPATIRHLRAILRRLDRLERRP